MGRLARGLFVAFVYSTLSGQASAQTTVLERTWAVWAEVDWSAPWAKHGTSAKEALTLLRSFGRQASRLGPDPRSVFDMAEWLAENGGGLMRVAAAGGEIVLLVVLATGETVVVIMRAAAQLVRQQP